MKKFINLLFFLLLINLLILVNLVIIRYNTSLNILPISYAKTSIHSNDNYSLIVSILKDANKNNFIQYAEYIDLNFVENIPNCIENKVAFTLSLPQELSFIAIYDKINEDKYKFNSIIDNLANIDNFYFYQQFLIVEQNDTNLSTDFTERRFFEIFYKKNNSYISVFNKSIYSSKIINDDISSNGDTLQEIENSSIDYLDGDTPRILCVTTFTLNKEKVFSLNHTTEFTEIKKTTKKEIYEWNPQKEIFYIQKP